MGDRQGNEGPGSGHGLLNPAVGTRCPLKCLMLLQTPRAINTVSNPEKLLLLYP